MADVSTILLDLDGVIRHFDEEARAAIERNNGLTLGALREAAFAQPLIDQVITGQMTRAAWTIEIGRRVGNFEAAHTWLAQRGELDPSMVELIDELRDLRFTVAILTNGTDTIPS